MKPNTARANHALYLNKISSLKRWIPNFIKNNIIDYYNNIIDSNLLYMYDYIYIDDLLWMVDSFSEDHYVYEVYFFDDHHERLMIRTDTKSRTNREIKKVIIEDTNKTKTRSRYEILIYLDTSRIDQVEIRVSLYNNNPPSIYRKSFTDDGRMFLNDHDLTRFRCNPYTKKEYIFHTDVLFFIREAILEYITQRS